MKIGLIGGTKEQWSRPFNAERTVNLYPIVDQQGKEVASLYSTPGLIEFADVGAGDIRGCFKSENNGRVFFVSGTELYEVDSSGSGTALGNLLTSNGYVSIAEGSTYMAICDGVNLYSLEYDTDTFAKVTDADLPTSVGYVTYIDGFFVVNENNTGKFYRSDSEDPTSWDPLEFATAESSPDSLICPVNALGLLWLVGNTTTEIWSNTGASSFPFSRYQGGKMKAGILAKHSLREADNTIIWISKDENGQGIVVRANGFTPQRISTEPIERKINNASSPDEIVGVVYQEDGHLFYMLTNGGLETSLVYDFNTQIWHERAYLNAEGNYEQHLANCHVFAFGKHLVGDRQSGKIYEMSRDYYDDAGDEILRERTYTHIVDEGRRNRYNTLEIGFETGVGLSSGLGSNPTVSLQLSDDGARTWSNPYLKTIGAMGKYQTKVRYKRLGINSTATFRLKISDPVKVAITGSYLT